VTGGTLLSCRPAPSSRASAGAATSPWPAGASCTTTCERRLSAVPRRRAGHPQRGRLRRRWHRDHRSLAPITGL